MRARAETCSNFRDWFPVARNVGNRQAQAPEMAMASQGSLAVTAASTS